MRNLFVCCMIFISIAAGDETKFSSLEYWRDALAGKELKFGYYENETTLIVVDKQAKTMQAYGYEGGKLAQKFTQSVITGKMGDKFKEGDLKTPVGVYEITSKFTPKDGYYGPLAFVLSYPNTLDKIAKKTGGGIWIHGYPLDGKRDDDLKTRGCVALKNDLLLKFGEHVGASGIVMINESGEVQMDTDTAAKILALVFKWKEAWEQNDTKTYLKFYASKFMRYDGMGLAKFSKMKERIFAKNEKKRIKFSNLAVTPYPNMDGAKLFRVAFSEDYSSPSYKFSGKKELYIKFENDTMKIIAER